MNTKTENRSASVDVACWLLVLAIIGGGIYANAYFAAEWVLYRAIAGVVLALVAMLLAMQTSRGRAVWELTREARMEIRRVVWPTGDEARQSTLLVVVVVVIVALFLGVLDWGLGLIVSNVIG